MHKNEITKNERKKYIVNGRGSISLPTNHKNHIIFGLSKYSSKKHSFMSFEIKIKNKTKINDC